MLGRVTTPQNLDERFRDAVSALAATRGPARARRPGPRRLRAHRRPRPGSSSTPSSPAATSTSPPAGCAASTRASTRSARPGTRATRPSRRRCARPTRRCCTTAPAAFYLAARGRRTRRRRMVDAGPRRAARRGRLGRASRSPAAGTRSSAAPTCTSSRPPPRSPRTCRARSALRLRPRRRLGAAGRSTRRRPRPWPADAVVVASFGDASVNHASATAAFNTAGWCDHTGAAAAAAVRLRGQRAGHQRPLAGRAGSAAALRARPGLRYYRRGRLRPGRHLRRRHRGRRLGPPSTAAPPCCTCPSSG